jgi:hypothetical protein
MSDSERPTTWSCVCGADKNTEAECFACDGKRSTHDLSKTPTSPEEWGLLLALVTPPSVTHVHRDASKAVRLHLLRLTRELEATRQRADSNALEFNTYALKLRDAKRALGHVSAGWTRAELTLIERSLSAMSRSPEADAEEASAIIALRDTVRSMVDHGSGPQGVALSIAEVQLARRRGGKPERWIIFETWEGPLLYRFMGDVSNTPTEAGPYFFGEEVLDPLLREHEVDIRGVTYHGLSNGPADVRARVLDVAMPIRRAVMEDIADVPAEARGERIAARLGGWQRAVPAVSAAAGAPSSPPVPHEEDEHETVTCESCEKPIPLVKGKYVFDTEESIYFHPECAPAYEPDDAQARLEREAIEGGPDF